MPAKGADDTILLHLRNSLAKAATSADSLAILYDVFDLSGKAAMVEPGWEILGIGEHTRNDEILADIIPQLAVVQMKDSTAMQKLRSKAGLIKDDVRRKGVELFIDVTSASVELNYVPEADRTATLLKYAKADMSPREDVYGDILDLYRLVIFLSHHTKGNFYLEYLDRLEKLIEGLPEENRYIRNLFYTTSANSYTLVGNHAKAVEADRELLKIIGQLEDKYSSMGRKYRNYDRYKYLSYRRMLRNYKALSPEEVKEYYTRTAMLAENNEEIKADFYNYARPTVYRKMAQKDYEGLIPQINKALSQKNIDNAAKREFLGMLVNVADSLNDYNSLLPALKEYNRLLAETLDENSEEAYRELQMRYEVNKLRNENISLEMQHLDDEIETRQKLIVVSLAAVLLLAVFVMYLYRNLFRVRQKARELRDANVRMHNQIEEMTSDGFPAETKDLNSLSRKS